MVILWAFSDDALGQSVPCGDRGAIVDRLKNVYAEEPASIGIMVNGSIIEVFVSDEGSFTILVTSPNGGSCLIATGDSWETFLSIRKGLES